MFFCDLSARIKVKLGGFVIVSSWTMSDMLYTNDNYHGFYPPPNDEYPNFGECELRPEPSIYSNMEYNVNRYLQSNTTYSVQINSANNNLYVESSYNHNNHHPPHYELIEQQIPPRMTTINCRINSSNNSSQQQSSYPVQQQLNILNNPYHHHQFVSNQMIHNNQHQNNRIRNQHNQHRRRYNNNNNNHHNNNRGQHGSNNNHNNREYSPSSPTNNPRGFQPRDAEFPWHLPPRLQRARQEKRMEKRRKQQQRQINHNQNNNYNPMITNNYRNGRGRDHIQINDFSGVNNNNFRCNGPGPLYLYNSSIPPPPQRAPPLPPCSLSQAALNTEYPPLPDAGSTSKVGDNLINLKQTEISNKDKSPKQRRTNTRKPHRRRRRGRNKMQHNNNNNNDTSTKETNGDIETAQCETSDIIGNCGDDEFIDDIVNGLDLNSFNGSLDHDFKSIEQEIVDNVILLQNGVYGSIIDDGDVIEHSLNGSSYNDNGVSVTIGELFGDNQCSSTCSTTSSVYTKSNTNSPNPKKMKIKNVDIVSIANDIFN